MEHRRMMQAEPRVQPIFIRIFSSLIVALPIMAAAGWLRAQPSRWPGADRVVAGRAVEVPLDKGLRGWRLTAPDRRFGGLSALAVEEGGLLALTDSGVAVRFAPPAASRAVVRFGLHELPAGPGSRWRKSARDSESLAADPAGRGWWVAFENRHSLWLFDAAFTRALGHHRLPVAWSVNRGGEALVTRRDGAVMVLPEDGGRAAGGAMIAPAGTADATRLPDGRLVLLVRRFGWRGFATHVAIAGGHGRPARSIALDLAPLDNMEGIAAARLPNGGTRLWLVSDDNFRPWMRTVLVALDLPPGS
jgi:hypothetical protein